MEKDKKGKFMAYIVGMVIFSIYALYSLHFDFAEKQLKIQVLGLTVKTIEYINIKSVKKNILGGLTIYLKKGFPDRVYILSFGVKEVYEKLNSILEAMKKHS
jgi:hypothetical protein